MKRRRRYYIDGKVQGLVLRRVTLYWLYCLLAVSTTMCGLVLLNYQPKTSGELFERLWVQCGPALLVTTILVPFVLIDCVRISNRYVGPIFRLRSAMQQVANGERINPVTVRENDCWQELVDDFNKAIARLQDRETRPAQGASE